MARTRQPATVALGRRATQRLPGTHIPPSRACVSQTSSVIAIRQPLGLRLGPPCASTDPESSAGGCYLSRSVTPLPPDIANAGPVQPSRRTTRSRSRRLDASTLTRQTPLPHQWPDQRNTPSFAGTRLHGAGGRWEEAALGGERAKPLRPAESSALGAAAVVTRKRRRRLAARRGSAWNAAPKVRRPCSSKGLPVIPDKA